MHISEGILAAPVLLGGAAVAVACVGWSLRKLPWEQLMNVGVIAAGFFVASLIHLPVGIASVHLIMNGLIGAMLGWAALPAIAVALFLQALLFQFGGMAVLGVNICVMGIPAVLCGLMFRPLLRREKTRAIGAFLCGFSAVGLSALLFSLALALSGDDFFTSAAVVLMAHIPVMCIEGILTAVIVNFLSKAMPELLHPAQESTYGI